MPNPVTAPLKETTGLLSYTEICELIERGVIEHSSYDLVSSASLDVKLGPKILVERQNNNGGVRTLKDKHTLDMDEVTLTAESPTFVLKPGQFVLVQSQELFHLPNNISFEYRLKSSMARLGLEHLNAGWYDAGWHNSVMTMQLKNVTQYHDIGLTLGDKIGQIIFFRHTEVPADKSYAVRGNYNNTTSTTGVQKKA